MHPTKTIEAVVDLHEFIQLSELAIFCPQKVDVLVNGVCVGADVCRIGG
jgi:hypothetical protein